MSDKITSTHDNILKARPTGKRVKLIADWEDDPVIAVADEDFILRDSEGRCFSAAYEVFDE